MIPYLILLILPMIGSTGLIKLKNETNIFLLYSYLVLLIFFIGLRHETGGDWDQYYHNYSSEAAKTAFSKFDFFYLGLRNDYLYNLISFIFYNFGLSYHYVNFVISIFFVISIYKFAKIQPSVSLALVISFPIVIVIMGMGFTRQGAALSFVIFAFLEIIKKNKFNYCLFSLCAILFHKSSIFLLLMYPLLDNKIKLKNLILALIIFLVFFYLLRQDLINLFHNYLGSNLSRNAENNTALKSQAAIIRVGLNLIASLIFLLFSKEICSERTERKLFSILSFICIISFFFIFKFNVFVDRFNYFIMPIQILVFSRFPFIFNNKDTILFFKLSISFFYLFIFLIWANFSIHLDAWIPYNNIIFEWLKI